MSFTKWGVGLASLALASSMAVPAAYATVTASPASQSCGVLGVDPDFVAASVGPSVLGRTTVTFTASETPAEVVAGGTSHTVRLYLFVKGGSLLSELLGPSTTGAAKLSGPSTAIGKTTERLNIPSGGHATYSIDFLAIFDAGIHPCTSFDLMHHQFVVTVTPAGTSVR
jgi:hypothetical protein